MEELDLAQVTITVSQDGGRERFMRSVDKMLDTESFAFNDER